MKNQQPVGQQDKRDARIRFAPDILRRLGEELVPSPSQGIIELVKNSYDADATKCVVRLKGTQAKGGTIVIKDNGDGMSRDDIVNGWLVLGRSGKKQSKPTRLGRTPAGNKGLGRLAALRLGSKAMLETRPRQEPHRKYKLEIDWHRFETVDVVEDVELEIRTSETASAGSYGTSLSLGPLQSSLGRVEVKRIARALILLADPFSDDPQGFTPSLEAPEFDDLERLVRRRYFDDADFHLIATVDDDGEASAKVVDWRGNTLYEAKHADIRRKKKTTAFKCPAATFELWVFILQKSTFMGRTATVSEVRTWLQEFGGVHLYEGPLRVTPYGNPGNDWLDMNLARTRSPEERPSTNTSIGRVRLAGSQSLLIQKTDRTGYIETEEFQELREFCQNALDWMHRERLAVAEKIRAKKRAEAPTEAAAQRARVQEAILDISPKDRTQVEVAFTAYDRTREKEVKQLHSEVQLYRTLSTAGITAAVFAHEAEGNPLKALKASVSTLRRRSVKLTEEIRPRFLSPLDKIDVAVRALQVLGSTTLGLVERRRRRVGRVEVHQIIARTIETFEPFLASRSVKVDLQLLDGTPFLRSSEAALESIITNLLANCLTAFDSAGKTTGLIVVRTSCVENTLMLRVIDDGPGIQEISVKEIWLPGETTSPNGTGLGLTIVRDTVEDHGGSVDALAKGELGGAEFLIEIPILGL